MAAKKVVLKLKYPIHKQGKRCGYDLYEDGSIRVAPMHSDEWDRIADDQASIDLLLAAVTRHCNDLMKPIAVRRRRFWESLQEDYGLPERLTYSASDKRVRVLKDEPEPKK